jgi:hypothetical protein
MTIMNRMIIESLFQAKFLNLPTLLLSIFGGFTFNRLRVVVVVWYSTYDHQ